MTFLLPILSKYWLHLVALAAIVTAAYTLVQKIQEDAIRDNNQQWESRIQELDKEAKKAIQSVRDASINLAVTAQQNTHKQTAAIDAAVSRLKVDPTQPVAAGTFIKPNAQGECEFTPEYSKAITDIRNTLPRGTK